MFRRLTGVWNFHPSTIRALEFAAIYKQLLTLYNYLRKVPRRAMLITSSFVGSKAPSGLKPTHSRDF